MGSLKSNFIVLILSRFLAMNTVQAVTADEMKTHMNLTFTNYDKRVRPITDQSQSLEVTLDLYLLGVNDFNNAAQRLETTAYLEITWTDDVLKTSWKKGDITEILVPQSDVWLPDVALQNGFKSLTGLGSSFHSVVVNKDGAVTWKPYQVFASACTVDVTNFPFDKTTCDLKFIVWSYPKDLVVVKKGDKGLDMENFEENSEWRMLSTEAKDFTTNTSSGIVFSIEMKRKPLFYLLNILVPVVMLAAINPFVFAIPAASGAKVGYAITTFLAFAVFLTVVSAQLPKNSEKMSTFAAYLFLMTFLSTVMSIITIIQLRLGSRETDVPVPNGLQSITNCIRRITCRNCCRKNAGYLRGLEISEMKRRLAEEVTWEDAVDALDFILFWIFFMITFGVTVVCFVLAAKAAFE